MEEGLYAKPAEAAQWNAFPQRVMSHRQIQKAGYIPSVPAADTAIKFPMLMYAPVNMIPAS